jgi:uncharacterized protein
MLSQKQIQQRLYRLKPLIAEKFKVNQIGYFGSYAAGEATENSDIDILVDFSKPIGWEFFDLQDLLEKELDLKVDLVSTKALKEQLKDSILKQVKFV